MNKLLLFFLMAMLPSLGFSSEVDRDQIHVDGSRGNHNFSLETQVMRTEYRYVQVPYQQRVCRTETRYRRECRQSPPRRVCRTVNKPVCRIVRQCRVVNGRQVCRERRVCRDRPVRVCRNEPGRRVCRDVPYQHQICQMVTRYRQERRAYQVVDSRTYANLNFYFLGASGDLGLNSTINGTLDRRELTVNSEDFSSPKRALIYTLSEDRDVRGKDLFLTRNYSIKALKAADLFSPIRGEVLVGEIEAGKLNFETDLVSHIDSTKILLKVSNPTSIFNRELLAGEYQLVNINGRSMFTIDLKALLGRAYVGEELEIEFTLRVPRKTILNEDQFNHFNNIKRIKRLWN